MTIADITPGRPLRAEDLGHVHFVGIGGAGMSGIARIMRARDIAVSGSDAKESRAVAALRKAMDEQGGSLPTPVSTGTSPR